MWGYLGDFAQLLRGIDGMAGLPVPELFDRAFPGLRYIRITRRDKVRQAVSLWRAVQTQAWRQEAGEDNGRQAREPVFSFRAINYLVRLLTAHDASWDAYFLGPGREPLTLAYEDMTGAHEPVVRRVLAYLGDPGLAATCWGAADGRRPTSSRSSGWNAARAPGGARGPGAGVTRLSSAAARAGACAGGSASRRCSASVRMPSSRRSFARCALVALSTSLRPAAVSVISVPRRSSGSGVRMIKPACSSRSRRLVVPLEVSISALVKSVGRTRYGGPVRRSVASTSYQPGSRPCSR